MVILTKTCKNTLLYALINQYRSKLEHVSFIKTKLNRTFYWLGQTLACYANEFTMKVKTR